MSNDDGILSKISHEATIGSFSQRTCAALLTLYALYFARTLIVPVITALVIYLTLRPLLRRSRLMGIPPVFGATAIMACLLLAITIGSFLLIQPARDTIAEAPSYLLVLKEKLSFVLTRLENVTEATDQIVESTDEESPLEEKPVPVEIKQPTWTTNIAYISGTGNLFSFVSITLVLLYFLLAAGDDLLRSIMRSLPDFSARRRLVEVIENVQEGLGSYLAQVSAINAGLGVAVAIAMWLLGMPSPLLWGVMAFLFNFIPIVGAIAGMAIIFLVALVNFEPTYYAFVVTGTFVALTSVEGQFITPSILGRSMSMSPVLVFLSIVVWGWMWGMMGVFLSVPLLIAFRMVCEQYESLQPLSRVLGSDAPPQPTPAATPEPVAKTIESSLVA
jgi:predicted PurR-regulated permease PerM